MNNKFIMLVGLPSSGKSTYARELAKTENAVIHSSDDLRKELFGSEEIQDKNEILFNELHNRIKEDLKLGKNVIYDACNINYKRRMAFLDTIKYICGETKCILIATPYEQCLEYNSKRDRKVPEDVIKKMYLNINIPQYYEKFNKIEIINNAEGTFDENELFERLDTIEQDNPHHSFTIGIHCRSCCAHTSVLLVKEYKYLKYAKDFVDSDKTLLTAALFHDVGKEFTKEFKNFKGEPTEIAHYYNHHNVSAYMSIFYYYGERTLEIANYIQWHMQPFFIKTEKAKNKFLKLVGQRVYDNIMLLHKADTLAH